MKQSQNFRSGLYYIYNKYVINDLIYNIYNRAHFYNYIYIKLYIVCTDKYVQIYMVTTQINRERYTF